MENYNISLGDTLELKKKHPCGSFNWEVTRIGADIKIKCLGCGHIVTIDRVLLNKAIKKQVKNDKTRLSN